MSCYDGPHARLPATSIESVDDWSGDLDDGSATISTQSSSFQPRGRLADLFDDLKDYRSGDLEAGNASISTRASSTSCSRLSDLFDESTDDPPAAGGTPYLISSVSTANDLCLRAEMPLLVDERPELVRATGIISAREQLSVPLLESTDAAKHMTIPEASFHVLNWVMNIGMFSLPMAFQQSGYSLAIFIVLATCASVHTAWLLADVFEHLQRNGVARPDFGNAALAALGPWFAVIVSVGRYLELAVYALSSAIVLGHTLSGLVPGLDYTQVAIGSSLVSVAFSSIPDKAYSYLALVSACSVAVACALVLASGVMLPEWAEGRLVAGPIGQTPQSLAMVSFCVAAHPLLPSLYQGMRSADDFKVATRNGWLLWAVLAASFGAATYYMFGDSVQVIATSNIGHDLHMKPLPGSTGLAAFSAAWVTFKLQSSQVPVTRPFAQALAGMFRLKLPYGSGGLMCVALSAPVHSAVAVGAILLRDRIAALESVSGGGLMSFNAFVFPAFVYLLICKPTGMLARGAAIAAIVFGLALQGLITLTELS